MADKEISDLTDGGAALLTDRVHALRGPNSRQVELGGLHDFSERAEKSAPVGADTLLLNDSADGGAAKFLTLNNLFGWVADLFVDLANIWTAGQSSEIVTLTDGATVTPDLALGNHFKWTAGGDRTFANPTNKPSSAGQAFILEYIQDGTGGREPTWGADYVGADLDSPPEAPSQDAGNKTVYSMILLDGGEVLTQIIGQEDDA